MRLQHFLSAAGVWSRREAEKHIAAGQVRVNGAVVTELGTKVNPGDRIEVLSDGAQWQAVGLNNALVTYALNKPVGYTSTTKDPHAKHTVLELVPAEPRVYPVGRLDLDSEGLLLLTNDGDLAFRLTHPSHHILKTYLVTVKVPTSYDRRVLKPNLAKLEQGILLDGERTAPAKVRIIELRHSGKSQTHPESFTKDSGQGRNDSSRNRDIILLEIQLHEGKNRQIRRMLAKIGLSVLQLTRTSIGKLQLADLNLSPGQHKKLTESDLKKLR